MLTILISHQTTSLTLWVWSGHNTSTAQRKAWKVSSIASTKFNQQITTTMSSKRDTDSFLTAQLSRLWWNKTVLTGKMAQSCSWSTPQLTREPCFFIWSAQWRFKLERLSLRLWDTVAKTLYPVWFVAMEKSCDTSRTVSEPMTSGALTAREVSVSTICSATSVLTTKAIVHAMTVFKSSSTFIRKRDGNSTILP